GRAVGGRPFGGHVPPATARAAQRRPSCRCRSADGPREYNLRGVDPRPPRAMALGTPTLAGLVGRQSAAMRHIGVGGPLMTIPAEIPTLSHGRCELPSGLIIRRNRSGQEMRSLALGLAQCPDLPRSHPGIL